MNDPTCQRFWLIYVGHLLFWDYERYLWVTKPVKWAGIQRLFFCSSIHTSCQNQWSMCPEIHMTSSVSCELYLFLQLEICLLHSTLFFWSNLIVPPKMRRLFVFPLSGWGRPASHPTQLDIWCSHVVAVWWILLAKWYGDRVPMAKNFFHHLVSKRWDWRNMHFQWSWERNNTCSFWSYAKF